MRWLFGIIVFVGVAVSPALAQSSKKPWEADTKTLQTVSKDIATGGLKAVGNHVEELEAALSHSKAAHEAAATGDKRTRYVLTDGMTDALLAPAMLQAAGEKRTITSIANPYPKIAFYLGSYYNEVGKSQDAVRVLEVGLGLPDDSNGEDISKLFGGGDTTPLLRIEYGAALGQVKRWADALASYNAGLEIPELDDKLKAAMLRGRGSSLTDLNRLDEAEAAYQESLKVQPNNPVALHELQYIAGLKGGSKPTEAGLTTVDTPPKQ